MAHLSEETMREAARLVACYPERRSALIPLCHLAQAEQGYLTAEAMEDIASLAGVTAAEVHGTASFYDMLHTEPVGRYVLAFCTNIACLLAGGYELLEHAESRLGVHAGQTTPDGMFTIEEAECLADCDRAPCLQVNHRFVGALDAAGFDRLVEDLAAGARDDEIPRHGVLVRVRRAVGLPAREAATAGSSGAPGGSGGGAESGGDSGGGSRR